MACVQQQQALAEQKAARFSDALAEAGQHLQDIDRKTSKSSVD
jgi:hypothetical protein